MSSCLAWTLIQASVSRCRSSSEPSRGSGEGEARRKWGGAAIAGHFMPADKQCEGAGVMETVLGHVATARGGEMLRALRRCKAGGAGHTTHALNLLCDTPDLGGQPLGYVR